MKDGVTIKFGFEGKQYEIAADAYEVDKIQLPDGRVLKVGCWLETSPPKPADLTVIYYPQATLVAE